MAAYLQPNNFREALHILQIKSQYRKATDLHIDLSPLGDLWGEASGWRRAWPTFLWGSKADILFHKHMQNQERLLVAW